MTALILLQSVCAQFKDQRRYEYLLYLKKAPCSLVHPRLSDGQGWAAWHHRASVPDELRDEPRQFPTSTRHLDYMSISTSSVADTVAALCSTYHDGAHILSQIKARRKGLDISAQDLELSITRAQSAVNSQYEVTYRHLGENVSQGDQDAIDAIREVTTHVNSQVIKQLRDHLERQSKIDCSVLQDVCESSQDRAVLVLQQLRQHLIDIAPLPLDFDSSQNPTGAVSFAQRAFASTDSTADLKLDLSDNTDGDIGSARRSMSISSNPLRPLITPLASQMSLRSDSGFSRTSVGSTNSVRRKTEMYKPMATTVTKPGFLGIGRRTTVELTTSPPDNPLVDEYLANALEKRATRLPQATSASSSETSTCGTSRTACNPWQEGKPLSSRASHRLSTSVSSIDSRLNSPTISTSNEELLPNETNDYGGFCRGAWRQQIGDTKRAMEERVRPGGMYNQAKYWQCKHCKFEGRLIPNEKKKTEFDKRVFKLVEGIQFRWEFMFKSHVTNKDAESNPVKATYGCIFCFCTGRGTPTFRGIQAFMEHLKDHRADLPAENVLYRMNCLVGWQAAIGEDFDINLIRPERDPR
ncbi:hypothetical protein ACLMJK_004421 [Lecanora helva]